MLSSLKMYFFLFFLSVGILISISSNNWILIWCGLELILVCFIPLMLGFNFLSSECSLKYFIMQSLSSAFLIFSVMSMLLILNFSFEIMLNISLMIKMGVAPFHTWLLNVADGLNFNYLLLLITLLKIPPFFILSYISLNLMPFIFISLIIGSFMGLNQVSIRKILIYSSIFNMGFMLSCCFSNYIFMFYLFFYTMVLSMFIYVIYVLNFNYINQFVLNNFNLMSKTVLFMNILSMGGMPPLLGFLIKLIVLETILFMNFYMLSFLMIMCSLMVMYYYIRISFLSILMNLSMFKFNINYEIDNSLIILILNLFLMFSCMMLKLLN